MFYIPYANTRTGGPDPQAKSAGSASTLEYLDLPHPGGTILRPSLSSGVGQLKYVATLLVAVL